MMSRPAEEISTIEEGRQAPSSSKRLKVTLLGSEWRSTKGGLSTINRELAIQLAKHPDVEVSVYLPQFSKEDEQAAADHHVRLIQAEQLIGIEPIVWLTNLPDGHAVDCVIGHGVHLGKQVQLIKRHHNCKWVQVIHTDPEELGMFKAYSNPISKAEEKHHVEVQLCKSADQVVAVGPKLSDAFSRYLRPYGNDQNVLNLTPGIFSEFSDVNQASNDRRTFSVLVFGRGDGEDFRLKGYDTAAKAIAELKHMPQPYKLLFVGAPSGKEEQVKEKLVQEGISHSQLVVRRFKEREQLAELFSEADLAIMPSRSEGFGLAALEALSAGLPVLVSSNSGLAEALKEVPYGSNWTVSPEDPKEWAKAIRNIREKRRDLRLKETKNLREEYAKVYSWEEQCSKLVDAMQKLTVSTDSSAKETPGSSKRSPSDDTRHSKRLRSSTEEDIPTGTRKRQDSSVSSPTVPGQDKVKRGSLSKDDLERLSMKIGDKWKQLARRLDFEKAEIDAFHLQNAKLADRAYYMLIEWRQKRGSDATYRLLYNALCDRLVGSKLLAEEFCLC